MFTAYHTPFVLPMQPDNFNSKRSRSKMEDAFRSMTIEQDDMEDDLMAPPLKRQMIQCLIKGTDNIDTNPIYDNDESSRNSTNSSGFDEEANKVMYRLVFGDGRANEKFKISKNAVDDKIEKLIRDSRAKPMRNDVMNRDVSEVSSTQDDFFLEQESLQLLSILPPPPRKRSKSFDDLDVDMI